MPAWQRYDGPSWRILRNHMVPGEIERTVLVLSAKYGLLPSSERIPDYDQRMTTQRAGELRSRVSVFVKEQLDSGVERLSLFLGKTYLEAIRPDLLKDPRVRVIPGPLGRQLHELKCFVKSAADLAESQTRSLESKEVRFFVPEWDDHVDPHFEFATDTWSGPNPADRGDKYAHELFTQPPYDGILVSLAQTLKKKGILKRGVGHFDADPSIRRQLRIPPSMQLMGDSGAFTYLEQENPPFTAEQTVEFYGKLGFDIGASVDYIVFPAMTRPNIFGGRTELTRQELQSRVRATMRNAERFMEIRNNSRWTFAAMGVIQALDPKQFARLFIEYIEMGYRHIALGGLVPKRTDEIIRTLVAIKTARIRSPHPERIHIHLFGVVRKELTPQRLRELGVTSFDSASYLRKAWLRSNKNYATVDGDWYAAIRVPFAKDPRMRANGEARSLQIQEMRCMKLLADYDEQVPTVTIDEILPEIMAYDKLLFRKSDVANLEASYRRTLEDKPWRQCPCPMCKELGIHTLIFRGINRNRRRGFHNLWVLKQSLAGHTDDASR